VSDPDESLVVSALRAGYGRVSVVTHVSFQVDPGEIVALIGRNGAGKTTSLAAISGLRYGPGGGTVRVRGRDISGFGPHSIVNAGVKLVPEGRRIFRSMTVAENLRLGAYLRRRGRGGDVANDLKRVEQLFPALAAYSGKLAGELSGGQQQMVAIGQALMSRPYYLLLDEPSSGLAPALVDEMYDTFDELAAQGMGLLVVDQSVERAIERSGRYYLMESGVTVANGRSEPAALDEINAVIMGQTTQPA
jgi:branched-chain amino acid transport system ATP-binding protein